jgi:hypothetical protein
VVDYGEGPSSPKKKTKNGKRRYDDNLVEAVERKATRPKNNPPKDHFEKLLEAPCMNHETLVKHALKDC